MTDLIGYLRVSTKGQAADGFGLPVQRREILKWCAKNGHNVVAWCQDEGISGLVDGLDRPGFQEAVARLRDFEAGGFIAFDLSRIARALHVQEAALSVLWAIKTDGEAPHSIEVYTATLGAVPADDPNDPTRTMIRQILGAVAQFQRAETVRLMNMGRKRKEAAGGRGSGRPPFGYNAHHGGLTENVREQATLKVIRELRRSGATYKAIAEELNNRGLTTKEGRPWIIQQVHQTLLPNPKRRKWLIVEKPSLPDEKVSA